jgi:hypothetical protein
MIVMTFIALLMEDTAVTALVAERIYPKAMPDGCAFPAIVVSKATGVGDYTNSGDSGLERARVQVDLYADDGYASMVELRNLVRRLFSGFKGGRRSGSPCAIASSFCINDVDLSDTSTERAGPRLKRRMLEFNVWNREV